MPRARLSASVEPVSDDSVGGDPVSPEAGGEETSPSQHREILRLAVPAFLTLIAEPLFLLADTAIVGHLGTASLAGLGVASAVLLTTAGIFVFLAYGTTALVARQVGAGSRAGAVAAGIDGTWLAIALGVLSGLVIAVFATPLCRAFGASPAALDEAVTYLRISAAGLPGMLVILATTGVLRGLQDTRTPLVASVLGFASNVALNVLFVYGLGMGIAGSAWAHVIAEPAWPPLWSPSSSGAAQVHPPARPPRAGAGSRAPRHTPPRANPRCARCWSPRWVAAAWATCRWPPTR